MAHANPNADRCIWASWALEDTRMFMKFRMCRSPWRKGATWLDDSCFHPTQKGGERRLNREHCRARSSIDLVRPLSSSPWTPPCNSLCLLLLSLSLLSSAPPLPQARPTSCASSTSEHYVFVGNSPRLSYVHMKLRHRGCT